MFKWSHSNFNGSKGHESQVKIFPIAIKRKKNETIKKCSRNNPKQINLQEFFAINELLSKEIRDKYIFLHIRIANYLCRLSAIKMVKGISVLTEYKLRMVSVLWAEQCRKGSFQRASEWSQHIPLRWSRSTFTVINQHDKTYLWYVAVGIWLYYCDFPKPINPVWL